MRAVCFALLLLPAAYLVAEPPPENPVLDELLNKGVAIPGGPAVKLPPPLVKEKMEPAALRAALDKAADRLPLNLFLKKTPNAPFTLKINSVNDAKGERRGQTVDLWFVAYGKRSAVTERSALNGLLLSERKSSGGDQPVEYLPAEQLAKRDIKPLKRAGLEDRYALLDSTLLDKVKLTGVMHQVQTTLPLALVLAAKLDERFADDSKYPNRWRSIKRGAEKDERGPAQPYAGFGGYVQVVELSEPAGALFVEMHFAFSEPPAWFGGPNLLRSKLPVLVQDNVRSFRRKLTRD